MAALAALVKLALDASGDECRVGGLTDQGAFVKLATARQSSQVSQLQQWAATSSLDACDCMMQFAGIAAWLVSPVAPTILACITVVAAMSTAMTSPAQPRNGSKTTIKAINR